MDVTEPLEIRSMYESSKKVIQGEMEESIEDLMKFTGSGASAGGARAKAIIVWNYKTNEIISGVSDVPSGFEHWLVKFDMVDDHKKSLDFTKLEYLYMSMAKDCDINVPEIRMIEDRDLNHFMIKRFDREGNNKIHMHSLVSMMHIDFNLPQHYSYDEALRVVWFISKDKRDVIEFFRRCVFNVIARNQDDHAKNTSFMMSKDGVWSLSKAYDITYDNGAMYTKNHQMSIRGKVNGFKVDDLLMLAKDADIKRKTAESIISSVIDVVSCFRQRAEAFVNR